MSEPFFACEQIFGYATEEIVGRNVNMLMTPTVAERHDGYFENCLATGSAETIGVGR